MGGDVFSTCARHGDSSHSWWKHKDRLYTTINTKRSLCFRPECGILLLHVLPRTFDKAALFLRFLEAAVPGFHKGVTRNTVCRFHVWIPTPPRARSDDTNICIRCIIRGRKRQREWSLDVPTPSQNIRDNGFEGVCNQSSATWNPVIAGTTQTNK